MFSDQNFFRRSDVHHDTHIPLHLVTAPTMHEERQMQTYSK